MGSASRHSAEAPGGPGNEPAGHTKQMPGVTQYTPEHPALDWWTEGPPLRHEDPGS